MSSTEFMGQWQDAFGSLDLKWHKQFLESEFTVKIIEFPRVEIDSYFANPPIVVEYVGIYHVRQERPAKMLREILNYLQNPEVVVDRAPLGTFSRRLEATGPDFGSDSPIGWSTLSDLNRINGINGK